MKAISYKYIIALAALLLATALLVGVLQKPNQVFSSVISGGEYYGTSTEIATGNVVVSGNRVVTLGSVVIASSSPGELVIKNATTTNDTASTTVITFPAETPEGTYTFDITLNRGLVFETSSAFNGNYYITFRAQPN